jgi:PPOX class probable F420-dependent enzyme
MQLPADLKALLSEPNYVHLTTMRKDGSPRNWVVWVAVESDDRDDRVLVCTGDTAWKAKDMMNDARVALSVTDMHNPYRMGAMQGRVTSVRDDSDGLIMDGISHKYTGKPFPMRGPGRVCFVIEPVKAGGRTLGFEHNPCQ